MKISVHIGSLIKQILKEKGMSVKEFAELLPCSRINVYDIFKRQSIDSELLQRISKILDYDFSINKNTAAKNFCIMAVIKTNALKFNELSADNACEIIMYKRLRTEVMHKKIL